MYSNNDWRSYKSNELYHHGILGMHWGIRRFQNPDGTLTDAGRQRYGIKAVKEAFNGRSDFKTSATKLQSSKVVEESVKELKDSYLKMREAEHKIDIESDAFTKNKELFNKYAKLTGDEEAKNYKKMYPNASKEQLEQIRKDYQNPKGQDAVSDIWYRYTRDNKSAEKADSDYAKALTDYENKSREIADTILKEYSDTKVKYANTQAKLGKQEISASGALSETIRKATKESAELEIADKILKSKMNRSKKESEWSDYRDSEAAKLIPKYEKEYAKKFGTPKEKDSDYWEWVNGSVSDELSVRNNDKDKEVSNAYWQADDEYRELIKKYGKANL